MSQSFRSSWSMEEQGCPFRGGGAARCDATSSLAEGAARCNSDDHDSCSSFLARVLLRTRLDVGRHDECQAAK